ncbi:MAG: small multi-drug export protein [Candidatus Hydrogenedentota bacterium]
MWLSRGFLALFSAFTGYYLDTSCNSMQDPAHKPALEPAPKLVSYGIFIAGNLLLIATLVLFIGLADLNPKPYSHVWKLVLAHFFGGRAANCAVGLDPSLGFSRYFLLFQCVVTDIIIMLLAYGLFVGNFHRLAKVPVVGRSLAGAHTLALSHRDRVAKYGPLGLMAFVVFPLWSTGPLVGAVVGFIIGMSTWLTFTVVIAGDILATAAWIWFFHFLTRYSEALGRFMLLTILCVAVGATVYRHVMDWWRRRQFKKLEKAMEAREDDAAGHIAASGAQRLATHDAPGAARVDAAVPPQERPVLLPVTDRNRAKPLARLRHHLRQRRQDRHDARKRRSQRGHRPRR